MRSYVVEFLIEFSICKQKSLQKIRMHISLFMGSLIFGLRALADIYIVETERLCNKSHGSLSYVYLLTLTLALSVTLT